MTNHSRASFRLFGLACLAFSAACGPALEGDEPGAIDPETGEYLVSSANQVDMNNLLSDADLMGGAGVTAAQVQRFLDRRGGPLKTYRDPAFPGQSAAQLIVSQSRAQSINPIYMLARIQTESSLISQNNSANLPKATGCGCPDGGGCNQSYRGFGKQVECSARMVRGYLRDLVVPGEHGDGKIGQPRIAALDGAELPAVHHRHHQVQQDQRHARVDAQGGQRLAPAGRSADRVPVHLQRELHHRPDVEVIVDDQDRPGARGRRLPCIQWSPRHPAIMSRRACL